MPDAASRPPRQLSDPTELLLGYLDFFRAAIVRKLEDLPDAELRRSRLPSGWTPLELLKHLVYMERRWVRWGFLAEQVPAPFGDHDDRRERWRVGPDENLADLVRALYDGGAATRAAATGAELGDIAALGGRFGEDDTEPAPSLAWILFHVLQEYARHTGHLDVARELTDGATGE